MGAVRTERSGSAVSFILNDIRADFHRPHPDKKALRYRVKDARKFLKQAGINTMNMMEYRGYVARIEYDEKDRIFVGHLAGIKDIVGFHGTTVNELEGAFHESVDNYIAISEETGTGDYSKERHQWLNKLTIDDIAEKAHILRAHSKITSHFDAPIHPA